MTAEGSPLFQIGNAMAVFQSLWIVALFHYISSSLAKKGVMASPTNFRISPGIPSGPADLFLPISANFYLITLVTIIKASSELANFIFGML